MKRNKIEHSKTLAEKLYINLYRENRINEDFDFSDDYNDYDDEEEYEFDRNNVEAEKRSLDSDYQVESTKDYFMDQAVKENNFGPEDEPFDVDYYDFDIITCTAPGPGEAFGEEIPVTLKDYCYEVEDWLEDAWEFFLARMGIKERDATIDLVDKFFSYPDIIQEFTDFLADVYEEKAAEEAGENYTKDDYDSYFD